MKAPFPLGNIVLRAKEGFEGGNLWGREGGEEETKEGRMKGGQENTFEN